MSVAAVLAAALLTATPSVGVLAGGGDPEKAGELQAAIEATLGPQAIGNTELASRIGADDPVPADPAARAEMRKQLEDAAKAYYDDRYQVLLTILNKSALMSTSVSERIEIHLWRAAMFIALKDIPGARVEVKAALQLHPDLAVDLSLHPLEVKELVDEVRPALKRVPVHVTGLPSGAVLTLEERVVSAASFIATPGKHTLVASAKGFRHVVHPFEIAADAASTAIDLPLPIALEPALAKELADRVRDGNVPGSLDALAEKANAGVLALAVAEKDEVRAVLWWREDGRRSASQRRAADAAGIAALADWVKAELSAGRPSERDVTWRTTADAGLVTEVRARSVSGGGSEYRAAFAGSGPQGRVSLARGEWSATLSGEAISFAASKVEVRFPEGGGTAGDGGTLFGARLGVAYTHRLGTPGEGQRAEAHAGLGAVWERHTPRDVRGPSGDLGLFPGHEWLAAELAAGGSIRLLQSARGALTGGADLAISPFGTWAETPSGTTGSKPAPLGFAATAGVSWKTPRRWRLGAAYRFAYRTVTYSGASRAPVEPTITGATMTEQVHGATFSLGRDL